MERSVFQKRMENGMKSWPGTQIVLNATRIGGTWSNWYDGMFKCGGFQSNDFFCVKELDDKFSKYLSSIDPKERKQLAYEIQTAILENYFFVPVFRHAFVNAYGPGSRRRNGRTSFRPSRAAMPIPGKTSSYKRKTELF
jgi:ABC-type transport system substrate-binding protein